MFGRANASSGPPAGLRMRRCLFHLRPPGATAPEVGHAVRSDDRLPPGTCGNGDRRWLPDRDLGVPGRIPVETCGEPRPARPARSEEHTSELQSLMRISYAVFGLKKKKRERA